MDVDELLEDVEAYIEKEKLLLRLKYSPQQQGNQSQLKICLINSSNNRFQIEIRDEHLYENQAIKQQNEIQHSESQEIENDKQLEPFKFNLLWVKMLLQIGSQNHNIIDDIEDLNNILSQQNKEEDESVKISYLYISEDDLSLDPICKFSQEQIQDIKRNQNKVSDPKAILMIINYSDFLDLQIQLPLIRQIKQKLVSQNEIQQEIQVLYDSQKQKQEINFI